jgi:transcriptional regulator with PAS, ATPase and Fis domain
MVTNLPPTLLTKQQPKAEIKQGVLLTLAARESSYIEYVLQKSGDNKTKAAKILGIDRVSLWRKLKNMGYS